MASRSPATRLMLTPTAPYDFGLALSYLRTSPSAVLERISEAGVYERALRLEGQPILLRLWSEGTIAAPRLALEVRGACVTPALTACAARRVRHIFLLDEDPTPFFALAARDAILGGLLRGLPGMRPLLIADPFEALLWAILGQQVHVRFARTLKRALVDLCGATLSVDGAAYPLLPEPAAVAALDEATLRGRQFSRQKASYVVTLARAVAEGTLRFDALRALPPEEALAQLTAYKGVGRWTAEYVLMRGFGAPDSLPAADVGLRAIIGRAYGLGRTATEAEVRERAEVWAGWRGWAAFTWWLALQRETESGPAGTRR
ncbi:MAG: DNA-3-methyladenine glycosylase 2 family protein [Ktedonobacterales bacterium]|nr:DNA-3-methyladenine glycosylase 2 family protein [Ktedonobacterales bacterium]